MSDDGPRFEVAIVNRDDRYAVALTVDGELVELSPVYRDRALAGMLVHRLARQARLGIRDNP